jgi:membrane protease subunit HflK
VTEPALEVPRHVETIWRITRWVHQRRKGVFSVLCGVFAVAILSSGFSIVKNGQAGLLRRFGRVVPQPVTPGAIYVLPVAERLEKVAVGNERKFEMARRDGSPLELTTGDENLVSMRAQIQYRVEDPIAFGTGHRDPEAVLRAAAMAALTRRTASEDVESILTGGKAHLQEVVRQDVQEECEKLSIGIRLVGVSIVSAGPPIGAEDAFTTVSSASAEKERRMSEADGRKSESLALARAEADRVRREAESGVRDKVEMARGASERFAALAREVAASREAAFNRLHRETLERVVQSARLIVLPAGKRTVSIRTFLDAPGAAGEPSSPARAGNAGGRSGAELSKEMALPPILPEDILRGELPKSPGVNPKSP